MTRRKQQVSLCMIVRNEEKTLPHSLGAVIDLVDEAVVVDTGSTDRTREVAESLGARVFTFPWVDSFSAARNETLRHARGDWVFWMDADDTLDGENREKLRKLFDGLEDELAGYRMQCVVKPSPEAPGHPIDHFRLFRRHPQLRWHYRVHEQVVPSLPTLGGEVRTSDVVIHHAGYVSPQATRAKVERNLRLLQLDHQDNPGDPFPLYYLGMTFLEFGQLQDARRSFEESLRRCRADLVFVPRLYTLLAVVHQQLGLRAEMTATVLAGLTRNPEHGELQFLAALLAYEAQDLGAAETGFRRLLTPPTTEANIGQDRTVYTFKPRHYLAMICRDQGRLAEAEVWWKEALAQAGDLPQGWLGLGQLYIDQGRLAEAEAVCRSCEASPSGVIEALSLRSVLLTARNDVASARRLLEDSIRQFPRAIELRLALCRVLLREGKDRPALERALRGVLELNPHHPAAREQLARLTGRAS